MAETFVVLSVTHGDRQPLIEECVESVAQQIVDDPDQDVLIKHLVFNNASTDDTEAYLRSAEKRARPEDDPVELYVLSSDVPVSPGAAYNRLVKWAWDLYEGHAYGGRALYGLPLDGDDTLTRRGAMGLSRMIREARALPWGSDGRKRVMEPDLIFGGAYLTDEEGRPYKHPTIDFDAGFYAPNNDDFMQALWRENRITMGTAAIKLCRLRYRGGVGRSSFAGRFGLGYVGKTDSKWD